MRGKGGELWLFLGLLVVLAYTSGAAVESVTMSVAQAIVSKLSYAIAIAEGFFVAGSRPERNHNPGDFETDITGKGVGFDGSYVIYASDADGWEALNKQVSLMFGGSHIYNPSMTIDEVAYHYADGLHDPSGAASWASNVAGYLGVPSSTRLQDLSA